MENVKSIRSSRFACTAVYLAVALPIYLLLLGRTDLIQMEGIIASGARTMLETHNRWVPRLYGDIYANKPALAYWLAAASMRVFGNQTEFILRLPTAMCALVLGLALGHVMGKLVTPRCGLYCALAAATSFLLVEQSRMVGFDTPLALGVGIAILAACRNLALARSDWGYWVVGYVGLLFGFLAKGLPAVALYLPGLLIAAVVLDQWKLLLRRSHLVGLALFCAGASAYLYLAYRAEGWLPLSVQLFEVGSRSANWTVVNVASALAKPLIIVALFLPWSAMLLVFVGRPDLSALGQPVQRLAKAAWVFLIVGILIFMANSTSSLRYYLPLVVPMGMLSGLGACMLTKRTNGFNLKDDTSSGEPRPASGNRRAMLTKANAPAILTIAGLCIAGVMAGVVDPLEASGHSLRPVATAFRSHLPDQATVYVDIREDLSSLFWYLDHPVKRWQVWGSAPPGRAYVVLVDGQREVVAARSDVRLQILAESLAPDGRSFALGVVERDSGRASRQGVASQQAGGSLQQ